MSISSRVFACACFALAAVPVLAQPAAQIIDNPPLLEMVRKSSRDLQRRGPGGAEAPSHEASLDLNVVMTKGKIWNPATRSFDTVNLRSYQGTRIDPDFPFISPTLEITPGDTIRISLNNQLDHDQSCIDKPANVNVPHCFNGTNLHAHGLWVNPAGNGDNVLIKINPKVSFQYEYNVPSDHPSGTFWYHTHLHGSTALQVASGMAGALVIRGNRPPTPTDNGDIDTLLKATRTQSFRERLLVFQQIQYACYDGDTIKRVDPANPNSAYKCDPTDVGEIRNYGDFGPSGWKNSGRFTSINGRILPTFKDAKAGQIERWRVVHGGIRDTVNLEFRALKADAPDPQSLSAAEQETFIAANCTGDALPQHLIAADGLTLGAAQKTTGTIFQPAYRFDALMVFPKAGTYCVVDAAAPSAVNDQGVSRQLLGVVVVGPGQEVRGDVGAYLATELVAAAQQNMPANVRESVVSDLRNGLKLTRFVPHKDLGNATGFGTQNLFFDIGANGFSVGSDPDKPAQAYDPTRIDRELILGTVDEWTMTSKLASHPFHIHVNPFQVVKILDPNGKDVSGLDAVDDYPTPGGAVDPQYRGMKGMWKDTLWVKAVRDAQGAWHGYTLVVRTKYNRYIGEFVLHCHILDHEDQGMMQNVSIVLSDGAGGSAHAHH